MRGAALVVAAAAESGVEAPRQSRPVAAVRRLLVHRLRHSKEGRTQNVTRLVSEPTACQPASDTACTCQLDIICRQVSDMRISYPPCNCCKNMPVQVAKRNGDRSCWHHHLDAVGHGGSRLQHQQEVL